MAGTERISSSTSKTKTTGVLMGSAVMNIAPSLRRFWDFTKDMAQQFNRHLMKDRTKEFLDQINKDFKNE